MDPSRVVVGLAVIVSAGAVLAGCSPDAPTTTRATAASPATGDATPGEVQTGTAATGAGPSTARPAKGPADIVKPTDDGTIYFHSPSGTFHCAIIGDSPGLSNLYEAGCQGTTAVLNADEQKCRDAWGPVGGAMVLRTNGHGEFECQNQGVFVGGTTEDGSGTGKVTRPVLEYGEKATRGPVSCEMAPTGVTCTNSRTGAGFTISREGHRGF